MAFVPVIYTYSTSSANRCQNSLKRLIYLLANHQSDGDESAFAIPRNQPHLPLKVHERSTSDQTMLLRLANGDFKEVFCMTDLYL